jgi:Fe-S oxidoreductase
MATREEKHSTRGRAHLLWEMMQGDVLEGGWRNESVKDALDLCLSCKACKTECPVNVDMATWKAEFLGHYYEGRRHPLQHYAFGYMDRWANLASIAPGLANLPLRVPLVETMVKRVLHVAPSRRLPAFAERSFRSNYAKRAGSKGSAGTVLLWPDTWNNYFHPQALSSAAKALAAAGNEVAVPRRHLCCGRPLYDFGFLDEAKRYLLSILDEMEPQILAGVPVVMLEPSCASVFRDELINFFPKDERAIRLSRQTVMLSEMLTRAKNRWKPPSLAERKIVVHGHCHQNSVLTMKHDVALLRATGARIDVLDSGCCGMAGPFGFEADKFEVSQTLAERVLLPAVRAAGKDDLLVSNGFSCREQIQQNTPRRAVHLAEVMAGDCR